MRSHGMVQTTRSGSLWYCFLLTIAFLSVSLSPFAYAGVQVPYFSQRSGGWESDILGFSTHGSTIRSHGCVVTCDAMIHGAYGVNTNPGEMNNWLKANGGFAGTARDSSREYIVWERSAGRGVTYLGSWDRPSGAQLNAELDAGYPVVAEVRQPPSQHFVVLTARSGNTYAINDPIYGKITLAAKYSTVYRAFRYRGPVPSVDPPVAQGWQPVGRQTRYPWGHASSQEGIWAVARDLGSPYMYWNLWTPAGGWGPNWHRLPGETDDAMDMTRVGNRIVFIHRGQDNQIYLASHTTANTDWSGWIPSGRSSTATPSVTVWGNRVYIIHKGLTNETMYVGYYDMSNGNWSNWFELEGQVRDRPGIAVYRNELWAIHRGTDSYIYLKNISRNTPWMRNGRTTQSTPSMGEFNGRLYVIHRGGGNDKMYVGSMDPNGAWSSWRELPGATAFQPGIVSRDNRLYVSHVGTDWGMYMMDVTP